MAEFLTTKEVAALLRIKERKVYELVTRREIPVSRVTGKLLFPRALIETWVRQNIDFCGGSESLSEIPAVLAGSHDPLLDWALRESGSEIATYFDGSGDGLDRLAAHKALAAGLHIAEGELEGEGSAPGWNAARVAEQLAGEPVVLLEWAWRHRGFVVPRGNPKGVNGLDDLVGLRFVPRQAGSGSEILFTRLLAEHRLDVAALGLVDPPARDETEVAQAVAQGRADVGLAVATAARQFQLDFLPLMQERFDLAVWRRHAFEPPFQALLAFCATPAFRARADELGGYDVSGLGRVHYNGP